MDRFQQYLEGLQRPINQVHKNILDAAKQPYIARGDIGSKTLHVCVPSKDLTIEFGFDFDPFPAYYAKNPYASLERIAGDLIKEREIEQLKQLSLKSFGRLPPIMDCGVADPFLLF